MLPGRYFVFFFVKRRWIQKEKENRIASSSHSLLSHPTTTPNDSLQNERHVGRMIILPSLAHLLFAVGNSLCHHPRAAGGWWWHEWNYRRMMVLTLNKNHASDLPSVSCTFPTTACYPTIIPASMDRASQHHHPPIRLLFRETMVGSWWCWSKRRRPPMLSKERWDVVVVDNGASWRWLSPWKTM